MHGIGRALPRLSTIARSFSTSASRNMKVIPVPCRSDNYMYLLIDEASSQAAAVDPFDVPALQDAARNAGVNLTSVLTTHHHIDHAGGNSDFAAEYPDAPIHGGSRQVQAVTRVVGDGEQLSVGGITIKCIATPCHTQDSICYHATAAGHPGAVFTGDTLFAAGSGRFFEGTGAEMHAALSKLGQLPGQTVVYNGHEYTASNAKFGAAVEPKNTAIQRLIKLAEENKVTAGLSTIADEKDWNVFMRLDNDAVLQHTGFSAGAEPSAIMDKLREQKNSFRG